MNEVFAIAFIANATSIYFYFASQTIYADDAFCRVCCYANDVREERMFYAAAVESIPPFTALYYYYSPCV